MKRSIIAIGAISTLALAGCAASSDNSWSTALAKRAFSANSSVAFAPDTITSALPSTTYTGEVGADEFHYSESVVTGDFTSFERGDAIDWSSDEGKVVGWNSDKAHTRDLQLTLKVDSIVDELESSDIQAGQDVTVWITVDGLDDADMVASGLLEINDTLVFLTRHPSNPYDGGWTVSLDGALVGSVEPSSGSFDLPVLEAATNLRTADESDTHAPEITRDAATIDDLIEAGREPREVAVGDTE